MVPPPQILITSPVLDLGNNQVPEITVTREVEGEEEEEGETASQIPFRGVSLETGPRQDQRTELFIRQRLAGLGLAPAPACRWLLRSVLKRKADVHCRCDQLLGALEQQLECPVCLSTNLGQVFQCHRLGTFTRETWHGISRCLIEPISLFARSCLFLRLT